MRFFGTLAMVVTTALISAAEAQVPGYECWGDKLPDFATCQAIVEANGWTTGSDATYSNPKPGTAQCTVLTDANGGNCQIGICFPARDDADDYFTTADKLYQNYYKQIEDNCFPSKAGGKASVWIDPFVWLEVINYAPPTKKHQDVVRNVSLAELHGDLSKRADTTFDVINQKLSIENPAVKFKIGGQLDQGSQYTISESDTVSTSVSASFGLEATLLEAVGVSAGMEVTTETSVTITVGQVLTCPCETGKGQLFWYPVFNYYEGFFNGDDAPEGLQSIWVPLDDQYSNYRFDCLG
ncbi:hypothetical protein NM208_g5615 [Fusarium decemcellulare]|uniref:Uncharacterized protein n=1 Tax=Fusarium decemcellulare TaxID=57161 RepID=A0ACC1SGB3_9HYPO|nr:hypothetical protein NM208_g5615 [Fusarium decemcellulare]